MLNSPNQLKTGLTSNRLLRGFWASLYSPTATEIAAHAGFDWVLIDMEHAPNELPTVVEQLRCFSGAQTEPIIRPPWNDAVVIKRLLDCGARSLLIPFVQNAEEAQAAVAATRYTPDGIRGVMRASRAAGYGRKGDYLNTCADDICLIVQIETATALGQLEAIAQVPGVDGVFIGPSDLAASMGRLGNPQHEDVQLALKDAAQRLGKQNTPAGILAFNTDEARRYYNWGYRFIALGSDAGLVRAGTDELARFDPT